MQTLTYSRDTIESYKELKKMYFEQIKEILSEYFDKEYDQIKYTGAIDLKVSEIVDILMLPFLSNGDVFTLNSFLSNLFEENKALQAEFKQELNKVVILEDLIEILTIFKLYSSYINEIISSSKIVSFIYDVERDKTNKLIKYCQSISGKANRVILSGDSFFSISRINEVILSRKSQKTNVKAYQSRVRSKSALINCIDAINDQIMYKNSAISA